MDKISRCVRLGRYFFCSLTLVVVTLLVSDTFGVVQPSATNTSYIGMELETASRFYSSPYYFISEDGYDHLLHAEASGVGIPGVISSAQAYSGTKSLYVAVNAADDGVESRSEARLATDQVLGENYFSSFAMDMDVPDCTTIFWQAWQWSGGSPPLALKLDSAGNYYVARSCETGTSYLHYAALPQGSWHRFFVDYTLGLNHTGHVTVWLDGVKKMHFEGTTAYDEDNNSIATKFGIYRYGPAAALSGYFDDIRWGRTRSQVWYGSETTELRPTVPALVGYWPFNETTDTIAKSGAWSALCRYVGEIRGGFSRVEGGYDGQAVSLNGTDGYVSIPDSVLWDTFSNLTVSCWFKTDVNQSGKGLVVHDNSNYKYLLYLTGDSGSLMFYVRTASGTKSASVSKGTGYYADGAWHYVAGVYDRYAADGQRVKLYVDGDLVGSSAGYNEQILDGDEGIYVGRWGNNYFNGAIDDVRIYNYDSH